MYKLSTNDKPLYVNNNETVHEIYYLNQNEICIRQTRSLSGYRYNESTKAWTQKWTQTIFQEPGTEDVYSLKRYPWLITDHLIPGKKILILKHPDGVQLYELHDKGFRLLKEDGNFHDVYSFKYIFGNFYSEQNSLGVMTSSNRGEINFYVINEESFNDDEDEPLLPLNMSQMKLSKNWHTKTTDFYAIKYKNQDVIALKMANDLEFYQLTTGQTIKQLLKTSQIKDIKNSDRIFFVNLTNQIFQDIVALTQNGLQVYQYDGNNKDYKLLDNNLRFTSENGWKSSYSKSISFMDINNDQKDDLIYTGKEGLTVITFDTKSCKWMELITPQTLTRLQRYGEIIPIINSNVAKNRSVFIKSTDGSLQWAQVISMEQIKPTTTTVAPRIIEGKVASIITGTKLPVQLRRELHEKPILRLAEYIDEDFIKQVIDIANGQVDLNIPLVDTLEFTGIPLKIQLNYNSQVISSDIVGTGWSFPIGKDYIYVDYQGSIFLEDAIFYLVIQGQTIRLDLVSSTNENILQFELSQDIDDEELSLEFNQSTQTWILNGEKYQRVYGKANTDKAKDCLRWSLSYPNWRGVGTSVNGLEPIVISWYLNAHIDKKRNRILYYDYMIDNRFFGNYLYTGAIFLKTIRSVDNFQLILNYEKKTIDEYTVSNPKNTDGKIEFPVLLTQDRYLKNYKIQTDNYQQSITFQYKLIDKKRILTAIEQEIYTKIEVIFLIQYKKVLNTYVLTQLSLARIPAMQFNYSIFNLPAIATDRKNVLTYRSTSAENIKFSYGDDYVVMGYDNPSYIHLKILNRELTELITSLTCPGETIKDYQIHTYKNYIVVFVINENSQSLNVFTYQNERWMPDPILYRFNNNISIQFGDKLIAVSDIENNTIHLFDTRVKKWKDPTLIDNFSFKTLIVHKKYFIAYDDNHLWIFYNKSNQWHREKLYYLPGKLSQTYETIKRFDVNSDVKQKYIKDFTSNCFQIMKNTIVINTIKIINDQLISEIYLITINSQLKVENIQNFEFNRDHILDLSYELPDDGSYYHLKYGKNNGKYRLQVSDFSGKIMDKFKEFYRNKNLREDAIVKQLKEFNESNDDFKNIFDKYFLINWQSLLMHTANEYIQHGDKDILQMTGIGWELKSLPQDFTIDLGQVFRIKSHDKEKKSFKLYKNGKSVKEFEIYTAGYMINRFPIYIAYQSRAHTVNVLIFKDNGKTLDREHIFYNEQLIMESNYQNLITKGNTTLAGTYVEPYECLIRPLATLISPKKHYYVRESILNPGGMERKTAYQQSYKFDSETSLYTQTATLIPTGNKSYAGWSEIIYSKNIRTGVQTKIRNWYNSKGIKLNETGEEAPQKRKQKGHKKEKLSKNPMLLMDQNEQLVICDLNPYALSDEMISYYGFESYETNTYWKFNPKNVVKNLNAFTGQNYLQINHGSRLEGTFKPRNQHIPYVASCWLRSTNLLKLNEATSILKMNLRTIQGEHIFSNFGQVKQQSNDWYYLELIIDFGVIKQVYKDYTEYYKNKALPPINNVEFEITILIESNSTIDLDHIRFSPLTHDFEAHVYNPKIGVLIATIHETGLVTRTIYNNMYRKIATIHQDGKIVELTSTSETGRLVPTPQGIQFENPYPSYLSFIPEQGSYETFTRGWETNTPNAWHVANPGQLSHLDRSKSHQLKVVNKIDVNSITLRFFIALQDTNNYVALILGNLGELKLIKKQNFSTMILPNDRKISFLPPSGEIIIMVEENFVSIWFNGVLIVDQYFKKVLLEETLILEAQGEIMIEDFMILNHPLLEIQYMNEIGEKLQVVKFETANTALVNQIIYDTLGRKAITAKSSRIHRKSNQSPLLVYRENFVTNINPNHPKSVWNTNRLYGEVHELNPMDKGVAFIRTEYWDNPLNEEKILGLPGPEYSTSGACATWVAKHSKLAFMDNLFPKKLGYSQNVQISSNGAERVTIYDMHRNKIAVYVHVPGFNHLLSTYEYNSDNQLIKILPPVYHEKVNTTLKITAYQPDNLTAEEKKWQRILGTTIIYNENGQVLRKITPDFGPVDYIYDGNRKLRFMVTSSEVNNTLKTSQIVYFDHNNLEQLVATGYFNKTLSIEDLRKYAESVFLPNTQKFQQFDYSDYHPDPQLRGRIKHCITYNDDSETILEKIRYNSDEQIVERKTLSVINDIQMEIKKYYKNDKIQRLSYPKVNNQIFDIDFIYNRLGQLTELKTSKVSAKFTYHSTGELATESFQSNENNLTRKYIYNSPGFLEQINDPFLTEIMTYTEKGYGQPGYGDGIIRQAQFINNWSKNADALWFQIT